MTDESVQFEILREGGILFPEQVSMPLLKESLVPRRGFSQVGRVPHPINFMNAVLSMLAVSTQEICIHTKRDATVGLGFETAAERKKRKDEQAAAMMPPPEPGKNPIAAAKDAMMDMEPSKVEEKLDPLCEVSFQHLMDQVGEDYENTGNGYIEVIRDGGKIVGLDHAFAPSIYAYRESLETADSHYELDGPTGPIKLAKFGEADRLRATGISSEVTELIHFKKPTTLSREYGLPQWLSVTPWLEVAQHIMSTEHDFYENRAVPDVLMMITGRRMDKADFELLKNTLKETIGPGKRSRSMAINIPLQETTVTIERLAHQNREKISDTWPTVELAIVSSHRVPPLLAGVVTPGKMAAANELPNALIAFQTLYVAQHQRIFSQVLGKTLGSEVHGLNKGDFLPRRITDFYDIGQMDTLSRMKQPAAQAQAEGRKLKDGLKE